MGEFIIGSSWIDNPVISVNIEDTSGQLKQCSMDAMDTTASSSSYECEALANRTDMLELNGLSFELEEQTELNVAEPTQIPGFTPVICSSHTRPYRCTKWLRTIISDINSLKIGTGLTSTVTTTGSMVIGELVGGVGMEATFDAQISSAHAFNVDSSWTVTNQTEDRTDVSIEVPINTEVTINMMRTVQDLEYKWKSVFQLLGKYSVKWNNGQQLPPQDVTTVLSGPNRNVYAFGRWCYPNTESIRVIITDNYGNEAEGCQHDLMDLADGANITCDISLPRN